MYKRCNEIHVKTVQKYIIKELLFQETSNNCDWSFVSEKDHKGSAPNITFDNSTEYVETCVGETAHRFEYSGK